MRSTSRALSGCQIFEINDLPSDWDCVPLGARIDLAYGTGLRGEDREFGHVDVYGSNGIVGSHNVPLLDGPGILVGRKGTVGAVHYASGPFWPIDTVYYVLTNAEDHLQFLRHLLEYLPLKLLNAATGVPGLSRRDAYALRGAFPPLKEQAAIACILDAVDTAIKRTREAVERASELRRGLLQDAFEFVGSEEPSKDTDAGRIPRSWDAIRGLHAFVVLAGGCSSVDKLKLPHDGNPPNAWFMKVDDFNNPQNRRAIVCTNIGFRTVENPLFRVLPTRTVVIAKRGAAILKNRVRITAAPLAVDPNIMAIRPLPGMQPEFLRLQIEWRNLSRYVEDSGVPQLNNKDLYPRHFLRAPNDRQLQIIKMVRSSERVEDTMIAKCAALERLKQSLMHDLLTGKVRVPDTSKVATP